MTRFYLTLLSHWLTHLFIDYQYSTLLLWMFKYLFINVLCIFRFHLWHFQQAPSGLLRGAARAGHDWRCQHPVQGGHGAPEEARPVNDTRHIDAYSRCYILSEHVFLYKCTWCNSKLCHVRVLKKKCLIFSFFLVSLLIK